MKKFFIALLIFGIIGFSIVAIFIFSRNTENKTLDESKNSQNNIINQISNTTASSLSTSNETQNLISKNEISENSKVVETELSSFSTKLGGDKARLNNINLTCNAINEKVIKKGETFSFNEIVGKPSSEKGYMEADVFVGTKKEKGFGGGNCQVSSTIYNAVLNVDGLNVTERSPHKRKVTYVKEGKDAAVSFNGGLDFKFKNNTDSDIKLYVSSTSSSVDVRIVKLS